MNYHVRLFLVDPGTPQQVGPVPPPRKDLVQPAETEGFGVEARSEDEAKEAARAWLAARGFEWRSISWGLDDEKKVCLIVYAFKKAGSK